MGNRGQPDAKWTGKARIHGDRPRTRVQRDLMTARAMLEAAGRMILVNDLREARRLLDEAERLMDKRC